jgi:hypothetical protein
MAEYYLLGTLASTLFSWSYYAALSHKQDVGNLNNASAHMRRHSAQLARQVTAQYPALARNKGFITDMLRRSSALPALQLARGHCTGPTCSRVNENNKNMSRSNTPIHTEAPSKTAKLDLPDCADDFDRAQWCLKDASTLVSEHGMTWANPIKRGVAIAKVNAFQKRCCSAMRPEDKEALRDAVLAVSSKVMDHLVAVLATDGWRQLLLPDSCDGFDRARWCRDASDVVKSEVKANPKSKLNLLNVHAFQRKCCVGMDGADQHELRGLVSGVSSSVSGDLSEFLSKHDASDRRHASMPAADQHELRGLVSGVSSSVSGDLSEFLSKHDASDRRHASMPAADQHELRGLVSGVSSSVSGDVSEFLSKHDANGRLQASMRAADERELRGLVSGVSSAVTLAAVSDFLSYKDVKARKMPLADERELRELLSGVSSRLLRDVAGSLSRLPPKGVLTAPERADLENIAFQLATAILVKIKEALSSNPTPAAVAEAGRLSRALKLMSSALRAHRNRVAAALKRPLNKRLMEREIARVRELKKVENRIEESHRRIAKPVWKGLNET